MTTLITLTMICMSLCTNDYETFLSYLDLLLDVGTILGRPFQQRALLVMLYYI